MYIRSWGSETKAKERIEHKFVLVQFCNRERNTEKEKKKNSDLC